MYLYNSATRKREEFVPNHPDIVKMYTCGPTVYHFAHIGNLRSYLMEDILEKIKAIDWNCQKPHLIISHTTKGKGVSYMENVAKWHHGVPTEEQYAQALAEIDERIEKLEN